MHRDVDPHFFRRDAGGGPARHGQKDRRPGRSKLRPIKCHSDDGRTQELGQSEPWYGAALLDSYSDANGSHANPILTTDKNLDKPEGGDPGDPLSGNRHANGRWRYLRQIKVNPVAIDPDARDVIIKIWQF